MFNKTRFRLQCFIVSFFFFQGKASHIDEKIVCMVEYIQLTTVFFFIFHSQSDKASYSCIVFLCALSSSFLASPTLLPHIMRRKRLPGL